MIKADELRLGNILQSEDGYVKVIGIEHNGEINVEGYPHLHEPRAKSGFLKEVELNADILAKCGFEISNNLLGSKYNNYYLSLKDKQFKWQLHSEDEKSVAVNADYKYEMRRKVKYLHQLQNLYFALIGEELSINI